jgi:hypothetical protein
MAVDRRPIGLSQRLLQVVGVLAYLLTGLFPYLASGLVVPPVGVAILGGVWALGLYLTVRTARRRPALTPLGPVAALAFWFLFVTAGDIFLGWTA